MARRRGWGEGSIGRRTEDGLWYARIDLGRDAAGKRRSRTVYSRTRRGAADKLQVLLHDRQQGLPVAPDRQTVGAFLDRWLAESVAPSVRPRTHESYAQLVRAYITPAIGHRPLSTLEHTHVQELVNGLLASGKSARTARYTLAVLRRALGRAVLWGRVPRNVALLVASPPLTHQERVVLTPEQGRVLLAAARGRRHAALYRIALSLGLRIGEVLGLRWEDVDLDAGTLRVAQALGRVGGKLVFSAPKTPRSRRILPLPAALVRALARPLAIGSAPIASGRASAGGSADWSSRRSPARHWSRATPCARSRRSWRRQGYPTSASTICATPARPCSSRQAITRGW